MTLAEAKVILLDKQQNPGSTQYTYEQLQQAIQVIANSWANVGN